MRITRVPVHKEEVNVPKILWVRAGRSFLCVRGVFMRITRVPVHKEEVNVPKILWVRAGRELLRLVILGRLIEALEASNTIFVHKEEVKVPKEEVKVPKEEVKVPKEEVKVPKEEVKVPKILWDFTTKKVLTMEFMNGCKVCFMLILVSLETNETRHIPCRQDFTTKRVLTMEFMIGCKIDDLEGIKKQGLNPLEVGIYILMSESLPSLSSLLSPLSSLLSPLPVTVFCHSHLHSTEPSAAFQVRPFSLSSSSPCPISLPQVAALLVEVFAEMVFCHGHLHGDPHPGNVLIQAHASGTTKPGQRNFDIVLLDHSLYREMDNGLRRDFCLTACATPFPLPLLPPVPHHSPARPREMDDGFRRDFCQLWRSLILSDMGGVERWGERLGVGEYSRFLPALFTARPFQRHGRDAAVGGTAGRGRVLKVPPFPLHRTALSKRLRREIKAISPQDLIVPHVLFHSIPIFVFCPTSKTRWGQRMSPEEEKSVMREIKAISPQDLTAVVEGLPKDMFLVMRTE
ncbi:unnamed protein product [Closterium sp. NIES-53]